MTSQTSAAAVKTSARRAPKVTKAVAKKAAAKAPAKTAGKKAAGEKAPAAKVARRLVRTRKARQTGVTVETYHGVGGNDVWQLLCKEHGGTKEFPTHTAAAPEAAKPLDWCSGCQKAAAVAERGR